MASSIYIVAILGDFSRTHLLQLGMVKYVHYFEFQDWMKYSVVFFHVFNNIQRFIFLIEISNWTINIRNRYTLLIETSFYFKQVHHFSIKDNAVASALPFLTMWFFSMVLSKTLDALRARGTISTTIARKIGTLIASVIPMVCLLALCYLDDAKICVIMMGVG